MDELADKDFSHLLTKAENFRYKKNWWIFLNKSGNTGPLRNRSDFNEALPTLDRLHQEPGEPQLRPMPNWKYQQWHPSSSSSSCRIRILSLRQSFIHVLSSADPLGWPSVCAYFEPCTACKKCVTAHHNHIDFISVSSVVAEQRGWDRVALR